MNNLEALTLEAFLAALAKQSDPLPDEIQRRLQTIGNNLEQNIEELDVLAESYPPLEAAYEAEYMALQRQGGQRQKFLSQTRGDSPLQDAENLLNVAKAVLRSNNSVLTVQDFLRLVPEYTDLTMAQLDYPPLTDEELVLNAEELFLALDHQEADYAYS